MKIDLGPLNKCVNYLEHCHMATYCMPTSKTVLFYSDKDNTIILNDFMNSHITVPTYDLQVEMQGSDNEINRQLLKTNISLKILRRIYHTVHTAEIDVEAVLGRIIIPVRCSLRFSSKEDLLIASVELGVMFFA